MRAFAMREPMAPRPRIAIVLIFHVPPAATSRCGGQRHARADLLDLLCESRRFPGGHLDADVLDRAHPEETKDELQIGGAEIRLSQRAAVEVAACAVRRDQCCPPGREQALKAL